MCINNKMIKYLYRISPISDRMIIAEFRYHNTLTFTIIGIYAPHADRPTPEQEFVLCPRFHFVCSFLARMLG